VRKASAFEGVEGRYLHLYLKVSQTPPAFPRRPGVARRKPLGSSPVGNRETRSHRTARFFTIM